ncbi:glucosamine-6-phosphate deaminase [Solitalea sp. MAHUQ-68]|uniref:Glucosamine-6-phosphate deaminase n=1 Tax=Solitalea agri TaxID=2953739 RepID=A0A9X2FCW6_9SPHI|nr:glucosamine-6-phosphate deaminase [Solitalea agri]MCO4294538.1 glucosamine-6-phosphate deaminase [Solitalea agri]
MKIIVADTYEDLSLQVANDVVQYLSKAGTPLFCPASGDTPAGLYAELVKQQQQGIINTSNWRFVGLDEWGGMNGEDEGSCRFYLNKQLFFPIQTPEENIVFFNGKVENPIVECERIEEFIDHHKGIDVVVLGLGMNGHIGMNEPGTSSDLYSHVSTLDTVTQEVGQKYFSSQKKLLTGLTLGVASIMDAKHVILMVSGEKKSSIVKKVIEGAITTEVPASLLRNHPSFCIYMDNAAAGLG